MLASLSLAVLSNVVDSSDCGSEGERAGTRRQWPAGVHQWSGGTAYACGRRCIFSPITDWIRDLPFSFPGGWCMHDEANTHYLDMIDQTTLGHQFILQEFGVTPKIGQPSEGQWGERHEGLAACPHGCVDCWLAGSPLHFDPFSPSKAGRSTPSVTLRPRPPCCRRRSASKVSSSVASTTRTTTSV